MAKIIDIASARRVMRYTGQNGKQLEVRVFFLRSIAGIMEQTTSRSRMNEETEEILPGRFRCPL